MTSLRIPAIIAVLALGVPPVLHADDSAASTNMYYVNNTNAAANDTNTGSKEAPWLTIQHAVSVAKGP